MSDYIVRKMKREEVQIAIDWAEKEGWNPGLKDAKCFYQADPNGFFIGLLDGKPVAVGSAVIYNDGFAFCGLYIVKKEYRGKGYGLKLTQERLKYVGSRVIGIDGVLENVSKYERLGYKSSHKQIRYEFIPKGTFQTSKHILETTKIPFKLLNAFDELYFPAPRSAFLHTWITPPLGCALGFMPGKVVLGYGVIRKCYEGYKIGPLFAITPDIAKDLFEALIARVENGPIYLDIPEPNPYAKCLVEQYDMTPKFTVMRMYRNGYPTIHLQNGIYGLTSFEIG